jgi:hypothetical protein
MKSARLGSHCFSWGSNWRVRPASYFLPIFAALLVGATAILSDSARAEDIFLPVIHAKPLGPPPICRLGVNGTHAGGAAGPSDDSLTQLRVGWYQRYRTELSPTRPNGAEYAQTIGLEQTGANSYTYHPNAATILQLVANNRGSMWLIGNEPDRRAYQDDMEPHLYAEAYHELYELIKGADPSAHILAGSIVQATEVRIKYLDKVLAHYLQKYGRAMPVDAWSIHGFILNEVSCDKNPDPDHLSCTGAEIPPGVDDAVGLVLDPADTPPGDWIERNDDFDIFVENILRFRTWMAQKGYRDVPLLMSEYGILVPEKWYPQFSSGRVNSFMNRTFDYLLSATDPALGLPADNDRLVQRLSWYSTTDQDFNGFLFMPDGQLTAIGANYKARAEAMAEEVDFTALSVRAIPPYLLAANGAVSVTLQATIGNAGNLGRASNAVVRFYNGDPLAGGQPIGAQAIASLSGCGATRVVETIWANVTPGNYNIYVRVDPDGFVQETSESNNLASTALNLATDQLLLPLVNK